MLKCVAKATSRMDLYPLDSCLLLPWRDVTGSETELLGKMLFQSDASENLAGDRNCNCCA